MSDSVQSRSEGILRDTIDNTSIYPHKKGKSRIEDLLIELLEEGGGGGSSTAYATALSLSIDSSTYVMTAQLLNKDGDPLGTAQTVDLPLESVVVGAAYDNTTKSIILTLQSGSTTSVPVGDLVAGLVSTSDLETALSTKQDTISDLATIRSNATSGAGAAEVVTGINSTANSYIEMKSGKREYLSTTVPTGNIPTGSVGMGFDECTWTYKSGTKVSEGESNLIYGKQFSFYSNGQPLTDYVIYGNDGGVGNATVNEFAGDFSQFDNQGGTGTTYNYFKVMGDYTLSIIAKDNCQAPNNTFLGLTANGGNATGGNTWIIQTGGVYVQGQTITVKTSDDNYQYVSLYRDETTFNWILEHFDIMLNKGNTALPYEPYGYKIPVICGNTTTNIYIDNPLDDGDSIDYATSQVDIPTVDGENTLICNTTVQPSKVSLTYTGWHSDLDDTTARIEALENAPAPSGGMTYDTLYEGTTASSYPYPLSHPITDYKFVIIAVGYSNIYTNTVIPVAVWSTITGGGNNYDITVDTAQLRVNIDNIAARNSGNRIVYGVYGIK